MDTDWGALPLEPLERIFRQLKFKDRLACSLVCQHWNRTLFCCPALARGIVLRISGDQPVQVREALLASQRNYRQLSIVLGGDDDQPDNGSVNEFLTEVVGLWNVQNVSVVGEPTSLLDCFRSNGALFGGITELSLELTKNIDWSPFGKQDVTMGELKKLHYLQMYLGRDRVSTAFRLIVPKLESAGIVLDSMANEEALYWEDPLIDLEGCDKMVSLEVDLNTTMWEPFFSVDRPHLERLLIRRASDEFQERDWDRIFQHMPNLRDVEMVFSSDVMLASLKRNCKKLEKLVLNGFCFHNGSFASNMGWSATLKQLFMDGWLNGGVYSRDPSLNLSALEDLQWKYVELTPAQGYFTLIAPKLRKLTLRGCDYKRFHLEVGPHLDRVDIDYYGPQQFAPNFFSSLHAVTQLILHINGDSFRIVQHLTYTLQLQRLEMICGTEHRGYEINGLFTAFVKHCPLLEELTVRNEHENQLKLNYEAFALLEGLKLLRLLTFQYITLTNVSGAAIRMERLDRLDVSGCRVQDPHGMLAGRFPIDGHVAATENMEWTVSSAL
ncbi:uncharacterized protein LOC120412859 [Culex pipiens pallens]|uniref:uncharacterized protein LOC120412859 n=1 Tax=Culex pipiens pallens TaxID=42434 RepID=UPI00195370BE|nr:uncharacterized protein LOC120412859 [Culex pipiens pallens]